MSCGELNKVGITNQFFRTIFVYTSRFGVVLERNHGNVGAKVFVQAVGPIIDQDDGFSRLGMLKATAIGAVRWGLAKDV